MLADFLCGVRVLDLSQFLPGPFATQLLSDMGADVLKVEPPAGDPMRRLDPAAGRPWEESSRSPYYDAVNAGKTVVLIDLKSDVGRHAFELLIAAADVLLESYRPGVLKRLGFGPERLREINPGLVHCALSGYGQTGPNRLRAGHDINYVASTGAYSASGVPDKPVMGWPPAADYASALQSALTITGALVARARTGKVQPGDIEGSTFTTSNLGMYAVDHFIAIINPPEAAILATGAVKQTPVVVDGALSVGLRMKATISADHRVSDGVEAAQFMQAFTRNLEEPLRLML